VVSKEIYLKLQQTTNNITIQKEEFYEMKKNSVSYFWASFWL